MRGEKYRVYCFYYYKLDLCLTIANFGVNYQVLHFSTVHSEVTLQSLGETSQVK